MLTLGSLFDGIGVFPLAASAFGITPVWASEIQKAPISITRKHFPNMEHLGDISKLDGAKIPPVDIITFGSPCQNLSSMGDRTGLAGEKSSLFYEAIRIITEMREATKGVFPTIAIWENVLGALFSNNGLDYLAVLKSFTDAAIPMPNYGKWARAGMVRGYAPDLAWRVLDSRDFGLIQQRKRLFLVADYRGKRADKILFDPGGMLENHAVCGNGGREDTENPISNPAKARRQFYVQPIRFRKMRGAAQFKDPNQFWASIGRPNGVCPTLLTSDAQIIFITYPDAPDNNIVRYLTPTECERLMGLPEDWTKYGHNGQQISDSARYMALGNSIALPCALFVLSGIIRELKGEIHI